MDPTVAQAARIKSLRMAFGKDVITTHAPDPKTGVLRVELKCQAGVHQWYFNTDGALIDRSLTLRLFTSPEPTRHTHNAIDN